MDTRRLTIEQARQLLAEYQSEFSLRDWTIHVDILRRGFIPKDAANITVNEQKKQASIRLLHPEDYPVESMVPQDMEVDLVHEILHVAHAPFLRCRRGSHKDMIQEQAIHTFSLAFVALKRETRRLQASVARRKKVA